MAENEAVSENYSIKNWNQLNQVQRDFLFNLFRKRVHIDPNLSSETVKQLAFVTPEGEILAGIQYNVTTGFVGIMGQIEGLKNRKAVHQAKLALNTEKQDPPHSPMAELVLHMLEDFRQHPEVEQIHGYFDKDSRVFWQRRRGILKSLGFEPVRNASLSKGNDRYIHFSFKPTRKIPLRAEPRWMQTA